MRTNAIIAAEYYYYYYLSSDSCLAAYDETME